MKNLNAYLIFNGKCKPAMEFYKKTLGGELELMTVAQSGQDMGPSNKDAIIHANLKGPSFILMASDNIKGDTIVGDSVCLIINCENKEEVDRLFATLGKDGKPGMPPSDTFWGAYFGTFEDQFGINWMLNFQKN